MEVEHKLRQYERIGGEWARIDCPWLCGSSNICKIAKINCIIISTSLEFYAIKIYVSIEIPPPLQQLKTQRPLGWGQRLPPPSHHQLPGSMLLIGREAPRVEALGEPETSAPMGAWKCNFSPF